MDKKQNVITYHYRFKFADGVEKKFIIKLDDKTLNLLNRKFKKYPKWARLEYFRCPNCSLNAKKYKYCPITVHIAGIVEHFKDSISYEMVDVFIETEARNFSKHTSLQEGINSLISIFMVSSGCPVLEQLKPMIRIHLPFSTLQERQYRVLTMYLLAQYYVKKWGGEPDWSFEHLVNIFNDVRIVNKNLCDKLREIKVEDATINALITLDSFAAYTSFHISRNMLNVLEHSFDAYLRDRERRRKKRQT